MKMLFCTLLIASSALAFADRDLENYRKTYNDILPRITKGLADADALALTEVPLSSTVLTPQECLAIKNKIRPGHHDITHLCRKTKYGPDKFYFLKHSGKTSGGVAFTQALQADGETPKPITLAYISYLLDDQFNLVEIDGVAYRDTQLFFYAVVNHDSEGNNLVKRMTSDWGQFSSGQKTFKDGDSQTLQWDTRSGPKIWAQRYRVNSPVTKKQTYEAFHYTREDRGMEEELGIKFVDEKEKCGFGIERKSTGNVYYPNSIHEVSKCQTL